jgi:hypothetical protein
MGNFGQIGAMQNSVSALFLVWVTLFSLHRAAVADDGQMNNVRARRIQLGLTKSDETYGCREWSRDLRTELSLKNGFEIIPLSTAKVFATPQVKELVDDFTEMQKLEGTLIAPLISVELSTTKPFNLAGDPRVKKLLAQIIEDTAKLSFFSLGQLQDLMQTAPQVLMELDQRRALVELLEVALEIVPERIPEWKPFLDPLKMNVQKMKDAQFLKRGANFETRRLAAKSFHDQIELMKVFFSDSAKAECAEKKFPAFAKFREKCAGLGAAIASLLAPELSEATLALEDKDFDFGEFKADSCRVVSEKIFKKIYANNVRDLASRILYRSHLLLFPPLGTHSGAVDETVVKEIEMCVSLLPPTFTAQLPIVSLHLYEFPREVTQGAAGVYNFAQNTLSIFRTGPQDALSCGTVLHELGHVWHFREKYSLGGKLMTAWEDSVGYRRHILRLDPKFDLKALGFTENFLALNDGEESAGPYATSSEYEDIAEVIMSAVLFPDWAHRHIPQRMAFLEDKIFKQKISGQAIELQNFRLLYQRRLTKSLLSELANEPMGGLAQSATTTIEKLSALDLAEIEEKLLKNANPKARLIGLQFISSSAREPEVLKILFQSMVDETDEKVRKFSARTILHAYQNQGVQILLQAKDNSKVNTAAAASIDEILREYAQQMRPNGIKK